MKGPLAVIAADLSKREHRRALVMLIDEYMRGPSGEKRPLPGALHRRLVSGMAKHPAASVYFAVANGEIAGCATCFSGFSTFRAKKLVNVHDLIVSAGFRRQGVGRALLDFIARKAKREGCCKVTLEVRRDNAGALELYRSAGFTTGAHPMYF
jgi:Acetyltransferases